MSANGTLPTSNALRLDVAIGRKRTWQICKYSP